MRIKSVDIGATAQSLATLLGKLPRHTGAVGLQAPEDNAAIIFVGDKIAQPLELRPQANGTLKVKTFKEVFVRGTPPDKLTIVLFDV